MDRRPRSSYRDQLELKSLSLCWHFWGKTNRDRCEHSRVSGFVPETLLILWHKCKRCSPRAEKYILLAELGVGGFITWKWALLQKPFPPEKECYMYMRWGGQNIGLISPSHPHINSPFSSAAPDASPCVPHPLPYPIPVSSRLGWEPTAVASNYEGVNLLLPVLSDCCFDKYLWWFESLTAPSAYKSQQPGSHVFA